MMTPVYNTADACLSTNDCSVNQYATRLVWSASPNNSPLKKGCFLSTFKRLFPRCFYDLKQQSSQGFHFIPGEVINHFQRFKQLIRNNSLQSNQTARDSSLSNYYKTIFHSSGVNSTTYCNEVINGTEILWQQAKRELTVRNSESNTLRGDIKE